MVAPLILLAVGFLASQIFNAVTPLLESQAMLLLIQPVPVRSFFSLWTYVVGIIGFLCIIIFTFLGLYLLLQPSSPADREKVKGFFQNILIMCFLVCISYYIYVLLVDLSAVLTSLLWNFSSQSSLFYRTDNVLELIFFGFFYSIGLLAMNITLVFRQIIVMAGIALFPFSLLLFYLPFSKSWGNAMLNFLVIMIFVPIIDALIIMVSLTGMKLIDGMPGLFATASYYLVAYINLTLMSSVLGAIAGGISETNKTIVAPTRSIIKKTTTIVGRK